MNNKMVKIGDKMSYSTAGHSDHAKCLIYIDPLLTIKKWTFLSTTFEALVMDHLRNLKKWLQLKSWLFTTKEETIKQ